MDRRYGLGGRCSYGRWHCPSWDGNQPTRDLFLKPTGPVPHIDKVLVNKKDHKLLLKNTDVIVNLTRWHWREVVSSQNNDRGPQDARGNLCHRLKKSSEPIPSCVACLLPSEADKERARKLGLDPGGDIMIHGIQNGLG